MSDLSLRRFSLPLRISVYIRPANSLYSTVEFGNLIVTVCCDKCCRNICRIILKDEKQGAARYRHVLLFPKLHDVTPHQPVILVFTSKRT